MRRGRPRSSAVVAPMPLPNQLERAGLAFAPAYAKCFGHLPELSLLMLRVQYEYPFECAYDGPVWLLIEPGSIMGKWGISLNARSIGQRALAPVEAHVRGTRGVEVTALVVSGRNIVHLEVTTDRLDGGLLNPLYLAGSFGVEVSPPRIVPIPQGGDFEAYDENLLPYYAGTLVYHMSFGLESVPEGEAVILELVADPGAGHGGAVPRAQRALCEW